MGAPLTILMSFWERGAPQDLQFNESKLTSPGRSIFKVTFSVPSAGFLMREAKKISRKAIAKNARAYHKRLISPFAEMESKKVTPKKIRIAASMNRMIFPAFILPPK